MALFLWRESDDSEPLAPLLTILLKGNETILRLLVPYRYPDKAFTKADPNSN